MGLNKADTGLETDDESSDSEFAGSSASCVSALTAGHGVQAVAADHGMQHSIALQVETPAKKKVLLVQSPPKEQRSMVLNFLASLKARTAVPVDCFAKLQQLNNKSEKRIVMPDFVGSLYVCVWITCAWINSCCCGRSLL